MYFQGDCWIVCCSGPPAEMLNDYVRRIDLLRGIAEAKKLVCIV